MAAMTDFPNQDNLGPLPQSDRQAELQRLSFKKLDGLLANQDELLLREEPKEDRGVDASFEVKLPQGYTNRPEIGTRTISKSLEESHRISFDFSSVSVNIPAVQTKGTHDRLIPAEETIHRADALRKTPRRQPLQHPPIAHYQTNPTNPHSRSKNRNPHPPPPPNRQTNPTKPMPPPPRQCDQMRPNATPHAKRIFSLTHVNTPPHPDSACGLDPSTP
jgi:hypothetical protein